MHVVSEETPISNLYVLDVLGRIVKTVEVNALSTSIDLSNLPSGIYILQTMLEGDTTIKTDRIVKQ